MFISPPLRILTFGISLLAFLAILFVGSFTQADETQRWIPGVSGSTTDASVWENGVALPEGGTGYIYDGVQTINNETLSGNRTLEFTGGTTSFTSNVTISSGSGFTVKGGTLNTYQITSNGGTYDISGGVWNNGTERISLNGNSTVTLSGSGVINFNGLYYLNGRDSKGFTVQSGDSVLNLNSVWSSTSAGGWFQVGERSGANGSSYTLQSGTINLNSGEFKVSYGTFTQSGGVFNMSNGSGIYLTDNTNSVFNLSGGTFNMKGAGYINAAVGTFNVTGGSINVTPTATETTIGKKLVGIFKDEATANNVLSYTTMTNGWKVGVVNMNNQYMILAGQDSVPEGIKIWKPGTTGAMSDAANWEGTTSDTTGYVFSGTNKFTDFSGNLIINGGTNTINSPSTASDPRINAGQTLIYNGGDNTLGSDHLTSSGSIYINGGRITTAGNLRIYGTESNVSYLEVNGTLNVKRYLAIAQGDSNNPSQNTTANTVINSGIVYCGTSGSGGLVVADGNGSNGELVLNGGTLQVYGSLVSNIANGEKTTAKFTMTGGTFTTGGTINIGTGTSATGTVDISGGELNSTGTINIGTGSGAKGYVTISGGEVTALRVKVGRKSAGDDAKLTITGGKLIVTQDICGSDSSASGCIYITDTGQLVLNSTYTSSAGIREMTKFQIAGAGDGTGALRFLKSLDCNVQLTLDGNATIGIEPGATFTQKAAITETKASALTITGGGTLKLTQSPQYTGSTTIETGTLDLPDGSTLYNLSGGSLDESGQIDVPGHLIATGKLTLNNEQMTKFIGSISATTIEKTGDGTLQLYSDADNMISAQSLVISSGRLDMKEYFKGQLEVKNGATLSPGNSVGTLEIDKLVIGETTYGGGFILNEEGATLLMEIGGQTPEENDMLIVNGPLSIDKGIIYLALADENNFTSGMDFEAQIQAGTESDNYVDAITNALVPGWPFYNLSVTQAGNVYSIHGTYDTNAVPEPSTWALLLLGAAGLLYVRKRKN